MSDFVTKQEIDTAAAILNKLQAGKLPLKIFHEVARLVATPTVEVYAFRHHNNKPQILLTKREQSDPHWGGLWHVPGSVILSSDKTGSFDDAITRVITSEFGNPTIKGDIKFVKYLSYVSKRGTEIMFLYMLEIVGEPVLGTFYDVDNLPENLAEYREKYIPEVAERFLANNNF